MPSVISNVCLFDFSFQSPKMVSQVQIDGNLGDWTEGYLVPDLMHLKSTRPFAHVYFSWDDNNLYIGLEVTGKRSPVDVDTSRFWAKDCLEVWIDLRNDRAQRRYTEHCHHFFFLPKGRKEDRELATAGECRQPGGAIQETISHHAEIEVASIVARGAYSLEARIPKSVLPTYDPANHPAIGFNYHVNDAERRAQWWSCGPDFSRHTDPSTWGSVELVK